MKDNTVRVDIIYMPHAACQHKLCKKSAVDMEPDRFEAWYVAGDDAEAGAVVAEEIVHRTEGTW